jgi:hypothetical protein
MIRKLRGEPIVVGICHRLECRKATGAVAMVCADWPRSAFTMSALVPMATAPERGGDPSRDRPRKQ